MTHSANESSRNRAAGERVATRRRAIGPLGTAARVVLGGALLASVIAGHMSNGWRPVPWLLALLAFPGVLMVAQALRARRGVSPLRATGPVGFAVNVVVFLAVYLTPYYASALAATSDAALIFYGASMLLAAVRGYAGCEVLAVSNWLLRRDDQIGCVVFGPVDAVERSRTR
ncbi:hypothetical protein [Actinokineospora sp.]|uniref:hypothetical protein n=1 Tax=Actinokineospora sp. TaxID=1872133 RepID=UPI003D6B93F5